ncbi:MAG: phosphatidylglycerophosphatase A [Proteobacteria bacterium]|nr:phosphatidylglycerophosphatase A [Pseudomonadota bacterium]MBU0966826.1 phosphatidylglycerophosphatase A [Pseudomonadota bacterium]
MDKLIMAIASGLYTGYLPFAPGTWGTLVAFPLHLLLIRLSPTGYYAGLAIIFVVAVLTAGSAEKILDRGDPGIVVIDEIIGMLIGLIGAPLHALPMIIAFFLFRFFDIVKPFPANWADSHLHGGLGIVLDDVIAGIYTLIVMQLLKAWLNW